MYFWVYLSFLLLLQGQFSFLFFSLQMSTSGPEGDNVCCPYLQYEGFNSLGRGSREKNKNNCMPFALESPKFLRSKDKEYFPCNFTSNVSEHPLGFKQKTLKRRYSLNFCGPTGVPPMTNVLLMTTSHTRLNKSYLVPNCFIRYCLCPVFPWRHLLRF